MHFMPLRALTSPAVKITSLTLARQRFPLIQILVDLGNRIVHGYAEP